MSQFSHRKGSKTLISAATELRRTQAWGLHFAQQNFAQQNVVVIKTGC
jgi:hypothetical protein